MIIFPNLTFRNYSTWCLQPGHRQCNLYAKKAKEKADIRATAFDYRNIKRGSNACIIVSYIIKKNVMESILDMMIDELYTYFLFGFVFSIFNFPNDIDGSKKSIWRILSNVCAVAFLDLKTSFLQHQAVFTC